MEIKETQQEGITVLALSGGVDARSARELDQRVQKLLDDGARRFVVDFREVEMLSSAELRVLLVLTQKLGGGGGLTLCRMSDNLKAYVDEICGLAGHFVIVPTRAEAIERLSSAPRVSAMTSLVSRILGGAGTTEHVRPRDRERSALATAVARFLATSDVEREPLEATRRQGRKVRPEGREIS